MTCLIITVGSKLRREPNMLTILMLEQVNTLFPYYAFTLKMHEYHIYHDKTLSVLLNKAIPHLLNR